MDFGPGDIPFGRGYSEMFGGRRVYGARLPSGHDFMSSVPGWPDEVRRTGF